MITREKFNEIKQRYGKLASWAVWAEKGDKPKSNIEDLSIFENDEILNILKPEIILVGLNISRDDLKNKGKFANFHSNYRYAQEYKLRFALKDTPWWGGYLTDIIKNFPDINSGNVIKKLKENPQIEIKNITDFRQEIIYLGSSNPIIIALGDATYKILTKHFEEEFKVLKITHFSYRIGPEKYKQNVHQVLLQN
jgi:hypothetical protein